MATLAVTGSANHLGTTCNWITIDGNVALPHFGLCLSDRQAGNIIVFIPSVLCLSTAAPHKRLTSSDLDESTVNGAKPFAD